MSPGHMAPFENGDLLRIPTEMEMFGENEFGEEEEGVEQFEPMKERRNRMAYQGYKTGDLAWYWLQNRSVHPASWAAVVSWDGLAKWGYSSDVLAVRPLFKIRNL